MTQDFWSARKKDILREWNDRVFATYPAESVSFFKNNKSPFKNPVGNAIVTESKIIFDQLTGTMNREILEKSLDRIIRIRAVQDFSPSQAVAFVFILKDVISDRLEDEMDHTDSRKMILKAYSRIDEMAQIAYDIYTECRERMHKIRLDQAKMSAFMRRERIIRKNAEESAGEKDEDERS